MAGFYERLMESGCQEDYIQSLRTEGDMTYADADWLDVWTHPVSDDHEIEAMINTLQRMGYTVTLDAE